MAQGTIEQATTEAAAPPTPLGTRLARAARSRGELVVLAAMVLVTLVLPGRIPTLGVYGLGLVASGTVALHAVGLILVYRSNRVINIAQVQMGLAGGILLSELAARRLFLVGLHHVCPPCLPAPEGQVNPGFGIDPSEISDAERAAFAATGWLVDANYVLSLVAAFAVTAGLIYAVYHLVIKRFSDAPRLVLTLVTIGLAEGFLWISGSITDIFSEDAEAVPSPGVPFELQFRAGGTVFDAVDVLKVVIPVLAVVAIAVYLRRSIVGTALRGVADNPSRAETLGVPVARVTGRMWMMAGLLSCTAAILQAVSGGLNAGQSWSILVRALAAAVFGGFLSLPVTVAAAAGVGVFDQAMLWSFGSSLITEGVLVVVVTVVLLVLRARSGRADSEAPTWAAAREVRPIPRELATLPVVVAWKRRGVALLAVVMLALPWLLSPSQGTRAATAVIYGIITLSLLVLTGWAGQISLGQVGFAAVGAWVTAALGWPFPFGFLAGAVAGALVAALIGLPALRLRGMHLAVVTLAFAVAVPAVLLNPRYLARALPASTGRPIVLGLDLSDARTFYYVSLLFLVAATAAVLGMRRSRTMRALIACRDNEAAAQGFGINLVRARLVAFAVAGFMAATAGNLLAWANFGVEAGAYGPDASVTAFLAVVLGGLGSVAGPLIGAAWLGLTSIFGASPLLVNFTGGVGTVVVLLFLPGGIGQAVYQIRDGMLRRVADRHHIAVPSLNADRRADDLSDRSPILPKQRPGGGSVFVPTRYRLDDNWIIAGAAPRRSPELDTADPREELDV